MIRTIILISCFTLLFGCNSSDDSDDSNIPDTEEPNTPDDEVINFDPIDDNQLMDIVQQSTFKYFWEYAETFSGAARERYVMNNPSDSQNVVATGGSGFGLMAIIVGIERNYVSKTEALVRLEVILNFFKNADRFHGAWPHWIDGRTGKTIPFSSQDDGGDLVETALFAQGLLATREYFKNGSEKEKQIANLADELWKTIEWNWYTNDQNKLVWHWSPNHGFDINLTIKGYNESLIAYVLAAASPEYSISKEVYTQGWASSGEIKNQNVLYDIPLLVKHGGNTSNVGSLFYSHYFFLWIKSYES